MLAEKFPGRERLFVLGEDVLGLGFGYLHMLLANIRELLPSVRLVSMYGRADQVLSLRAEQFSRLKELGLYMVYVGVESGSDRVLLFCEKGVDSKTMLRAFERLDAAGIGYSASVILGLGGQALCLEHAERTAWLLNQIHPRSIRLLSLVSLPGTALERKIRQHLFRPLSPQALLLEERLLLEYLDMDGCLFAANHITNRVPLCGWLSIDKQRLCGQLDAAICAGEICRTSPHFL